MTNINEETASPSNVVELPEDIKPEEDIGVEEQQALVDDEQNMNMKEEEGGDDMTAEEADEERKEDNNEEMEEAARGDEAHVCYVCDKTLSSKSSLNLHINSVHRGRRFPCEECDKSFTDSTNLTQAL